MSEQGRLARRNPAKNITRRDNAMAWPMGVDWGTLRQDSFEALPIIGRLRDRMLARRAS